MHKKPDLSGFLLFLNISQSPYPASLVKAVTTHPQPSASLVKGRGTTLVVEGFHSRHYNLSKYYQ
jgi:hypothetical protein